MKKNKKICLNCGHNCHCGSKCRPKMKDGDGKSIKIDCCYKCSCKN